MSARVAAAAGLLLLTLAPAAARAEAISGATLRPLAARAAVDPAALARLRAVTSVDGRPANLRLALDGARGAALRARLRILADAPVLASAAPAPAVRDRAAAILRQGRFHDAAPMRPLRRLLDWLGAALRAALSPVESGLGRLAGAVPGGVAALWGVAALVVVVAASAFAARTVRRPGAGLAGRTAAGAGGAHLDPVAVEREADAAARRGDRELEMRLRFRAALLRLDRARVIAFHESLTTGDVRRVVDVPAFGEAADRFEAVVYGRRPAKAGDVEALRRDLASALQQAGRG